jgi:cytochrome b subunit of formate dehydrogenase
MTKSETIAIKRHSLLYRILHWLIVLEVLLLLLTGLAVSEYIPLTWISRGVGRSLHILLGLTWTGLITFFVYYFMMSGEFKWFGVSKIAPAIDFFVHEVKSFISGKKVKSPVGYNRDEKKYVQKIVPTEVLAWWGWFSLWAIMVLTGLAMLFPENFGFINRLCFAILPAFSKATAATRFIHLFASMGIVIYMMIHAYASWTFGMVGSMISGNNEEPVIHLEK